VAGLIPETVVRPGAVWTVAVNLNQNLLGKTMLVLGRPATAVTDLSPGEWARLHVELKDLVPALGRLFSPDQVNLAFLMNQDAQVHLHVIPRYRSPRTWAGLVFTDAHWGSAFGPEQRPLPRELLAQLAAEIRAELGGSG
jgi:diadenosine tetraphosphate (Ap4A) HIT family hydrolase